MAPIKAMGKKAAALYFARNIAWRVKGISNRLVSSGNLTSLNGYTFTWSGRRLAAAVNANTDISYTYNHNGIRTSKTVNGTTTYYEVDENNNVVKQYELVNDAETNVIEFVYDSSNSPIYFTYNNATYYYEKNLQGDIVAILDGSGGIKALDRGRF